MPNNLVKGLPGEPTLQGDFNITDDDQTTSLFKVAEGTGNTTVAGTFTATGAQTLTGNTTLSGTLTVAGAVTHTTTSTFTGATTQTGVLTLADDLIGGASSDITINTNKFTVAASSGNTLVAGTLAVTGTATMAGINSTGTHAVTGAVTVSTTLGVTGTSTLGVTDTAALTCTTFAPTGQVTLSAKPIIPTATPASNAAGTAGMLAWDADYFYVCTATNTWERAALTGGY